MVGLYQGTERCTPRSMAGTRLSRLSWPRLLAKSWKVLNRVSREVGSQNGEAKTPGAFLSCLVLGVLRNIGCSSWISLREEKAWARVWSRSAYAFPGKPDTAS